MANFYGHKTSNYCPTQEENLNALLKISLSELAVFTSNFYSLVCRYTVSEVNWPANLTFRGNIDLNCFWWLFNFVRSKERMLCKRLRSILGKEGRRPTHRASQLRLRLGKWLGCVIWRGMKCNLRFSLGLTRPGRVSWFWEQLVWYVGELFPIFKALHINMISFNPYNDPIQ